MKVPHQRLPRRVLLCRLGKIQRGVDNLVQERLDEAGIHRLPWLSFWRYPLKDVYRIVTSSKLPGIGYRTPRIFFHPRTAWKTSSYGSHGWEYEMEVNGDISRKSERTYTPSRCSLNIWSKVRQISMIMYNFPCVQENKIKSKRSVLEKANRKANQQILQFLHQHQRLSVFQGDSILPQDLRWSC